MRGSACPSGVQYGRLIEDARAEIESKTQRPFLTRLTRGFVFNMLLPSRMMLQLAGFAMGVYQYAGVRKLASALGVFSLFFRN